jgi:hypothetical protein
LSIRWFKFLFSPSNLFSTPNYRASVAEATRAADRLRPAMAFNRAILLGHEVARAFGVERVPPMIWTLTPSPPLPRLEVAVLPHPSPRNSFWRNATCRNKAGAFLREEAAQAAAQALDEVAEFTTAALPELRAIANVS